MTKNEVIKAIAKKTNLPERDVLVAVYSFLDTVKESLANNEPIFIRGFGTFENKLRAKKKARNISKGTSLEIPAHHIPVLKFAPDIKEKVKSTVLVK